MKEGKHNIKRSPSKLTDLMIFRNRWWQHLIFWGLALAILFNIFNSSGSIEKIDVIYTSIFVLPLVAVVYLNLYLAIPRFLRGEKYFLYGISALVLMGGGALFLYFLFESWIDLVLPGYYFISYYSIPVLMLYTGSFLILSTLLKLSRSWFMLLRVERMSSTHQLQSLQSQINPHFLLNSLQTIYALSLEKSERSPEVILQLSDILKYNLYDTAQPTVKLEKEIRMIRDYVEMYRHRVDHEKAEIKLEVKGEARDQVIAPMLLLPFIENAFKHGLRSEMSDTFIHVQMELQEAMLKFRVDNSHGKSDGVDLENNKGIGIENTRQRLLLLYPGKYHLDIDEKANKFTVKLSIELNP